MGEMAKLTVKPRKNHPKESRQRPTQEVHKCWLIKPSQFNFTQPFDGSPNYTEYNLCFSFEKYFLKMKFMFRCNIYFFKSFNVFYYRK